MVEDTDSLQISIHVETRLDDLIFFLFENGVQTGPRSRKGRVGTKRLSHCVRNMPRTRPIRPYATGTSSLDASRNFIACMSSNTCQPGPRDGAATRPLSNSPILQLLPTRDLPSLRFLDPPPHPHSSPNTPHHVTRWNTVANVTYRDDHTQSSGGDPVTTPATRRPSSARTWQRPRTSARSV